MYDLHNVINISVDASHVLILSYYLVNNKICLKQTFIFNGFETYCTIPECDTIRELTKTCQWVTSILHICMIYNLLDEWP